VSPPTRSAPDLFARLSRGDRSAFDEVHARYGARVAAIARRSIGPRLRTRLETMDLTQEAWAAVACDPPAVPFSGERDFLGWIAGIVERRALREARRWMRQRRQSEREAAGADPALHIDRRAARPSQIVLREEAAGRMNAAVARLEKEDRDVILLRHVLGLPWRDVAAALGITQECAQMRCTRARRRLAQLMR